MAAGRIRLQRTSSLNAAAKIASQAKSESDQRLPVVPRPKTLRDAPVSTSPSPSASDCHSDDDDDASDIEPPPSKRRKTAVSQSKTQTKTKTSAYSKTAAAEIHNRLFNNSQLLPTDPAPARLPHRRHDVTYHRPLLLSATDGASARDALLAWFDGASTNRGMPWRKPWLDPSTNPPPTPAELNRRAYEVWISEIMLQQTRVAVVIDYWNRWMAKWPTIADLAAASADEVLSMWRGLGYYSRATRIHDAAKKIVREMGGQLPSEAAELEKAVPGVGRYTAGAISAIVFGRPAALVDGNVLRVLSRQLGILGDVKGNKMVIDTLWAAADALVREVAWDGAAAKDRQEPPRSDRPGRWGQALMELGSTICTPRPNCASCPITSTCRAYAEASSAAPSKNDAPNGTQREIGEIEDLCGLCEPIALFSDMTDDGEDRPVKPAKFQKRKKANTSGAASSKPSGDGDFGYISQYVSRFPLRVVKKAVREEELLVCAIRRRDGRYLIKKRPPKGLLAGLWEFPSYTLPKLSMQSSKRQQLAAEFAPAFLEISSKPSSRSALIHNGEIGTVPWLFSHLRSTMHVHSFDFDPSGSCSEMEAVMQGSPSRWVLAHELDSESMGTGMRKCWAMVTAAQD